MIPYFALKVINLVAKLQKKVELHVRNTKLFSNFAVKIV